MTSMTSPRPAMPAAHAPLAKVFWLYGVVAGFALTALLGAVGSYAPAAKPFGAALVLAYMLAWYVVLWRAAGRYTGPALWKWAARAVVFMPLIGFVIGVSLTAGTSPPRVVKPVAPAQTQGEWLPAPPNLKPFHGKLDGEK